MKIFILLMAGFFFFGDFAQGEETFVLKDELKRNLSKVEKSIASERKKLTPGVLNQDLEFNLAKLLVERSRLLEGLAEETEHTSDELDLSEGAEARDEAIKQLRHLVEVAPGHSSMDQIQLLLGVELRKTKEQQASLSSLRRVVEEFPRSPLVARARLEMARSFLDQKQTDLAIAEYKKVLDLPYASAGATAAYRLGLCENERGRSFEALKFFQMTLGDAAADGPALDNDSKIGRLRELALEASLVSYAGIPKAVLEKEQNFYPPQKFYQRLVADKFQLRQVLKTLEKNLEAKNRFDEAAEVSQIVLMTGGTDAEKLEEMALLSKLLRNASTFRYSEQGLRAITESLWSLEERQKSKELVAIEPVVRDLLTQAQRIALKAKRPEDYLLLAHGYRQYLLIYPNSKERLNLKVNLAESLYLGQSYLQAGQIYFEVAQELAAKQKNSARAKSLLDSGAHSYDLALGKPNLEMADRVWGQAGLRNLVLAYEKNFPLEKNLGALLFNLAKGDYENKQYAEAIKGWQAFLLNQPSSPLTAEAAISLLDSYYKTEDFSSFVSEGKKWLAKGILNPAATKDLTENLRQVELKLVQKGAGEFASEAYAQKFLQLSKDQKDATLSETALHEAFMSLRAAYNPKIYEVGLEYVQKFQTNSKAKDVHLYLIQAALDTVDLDRAANLMGSFVQFFPNDEKGKNFPAQILMIREQLGEVDPVLKSRVEKNDLVGACELAMAFGRWSKLWELSSQIPGGRGLYYHGLAALRMGSVIEGRETLRRALAASGGVALSKEMRAHAGIIGAEARLENFVELGKDSFSVANLQKLLALSKEISQDLKNVLDQESGRWSVAALAVNARLSRSFAEILGSAKPSAGISPEVLNKLVGPRIQTEREAAKTLNQRCLEVASQNEIPSEYSKMCASSSLLVKESDELKARPEGGQRAYVLTPKAHSYLLKDPKSVRALKAVFNANVKAKNDYAAYALASRMTELEGGSTTTWTDLGSAALNVGLPQVALVAFNKALKIDGKNSQAIQMTAKLLPIRKLEKENRVPANAAEKVNP